MIKPEHPVQNRSAQPRLLLSAITLAVLTLANQTAALAQEAEAPMQRVEVTGSSIKRLATEASLPVSTVKAEDLVKQGMTTLADLMMALPQSASLAPSNAGSGTNINLRGLGVNRTLVLLNGRRLANEAIADGYANLDVIPMSAIARVEILRDGASSIYGSDAIGGVVNFITRTQYEGLEATAQHVEVGRRGGGEEQRGTLTWGKGNLERDGWSVWGTVDAHKRSALAAKDRASLSSPELLTSIGRSPSLGTGGNATPANFTTATNRTARNPYAATGCVAPYSLPGRAGTCVLDANAYGNALYENQQVTFYARASKKLGEDHTVSIDYSRGEEHIIGTRNPTNALAVNGVQPHRPSTCKGDPGNSGGVPAMSGLNGATLVPTWAVADYGAAATKDVQLNQRVAITAEGVVKGWDYKAGLVIGVSNRDNYYDNGYFTGQGLLDGLRNGKLNPFGLQDAEGRAYLESINVDGQKNRESKSTFTGVDFTASRAVMELGGGDLALAVGSSFSRDTNEDERLALVRQVTYANASPGRGEGGRNVAALFAELDMPFTKKLNVNVAARDDHFSDFGNTINPKVSFRYEATKQLMFRGSANTGFRAPTLFDRYGYRLPGATALTLAKWDDPKLCPGGRPGVAGTGTALPGYVSANVCNVQLPRQTGSNADVTPEKSKGFTFGTVFEPTATSMVSIDYWNIRMTNMLANLPEQIYFLDPAKYASSFVRNADGTLNYIQNTIMNLGGQKAAGIDVSASYAFPRSSFGDFKVSIDGTYLTQFDNQLDNGSPYVSNVGRFGLASNGTTSSFPIVTYRWKHVAKLNWAMGNWNSTLTQNYNSKYEDQNLVAQQYWRDINSYKNWQWTTTYTGFKNLSLTAGITNLFDSKPPVTNSSLYSNGYLSSAASPIGRAFNFRATYKFY